MLRTVAALWLACVLALSSRGFSLVSAQMSAYHMDMQSPDWTSGRAIFAIVYASIVMPAFIVTLVMLWRRRKTYPIAGEWNREGNPSSLLCESVRVGD